MIGIFDSGVGGLMVFHYLSELLPEYDYLYFGDQANVPYGSRDPEDIRALTEKNVEFLFQKGAKMVLLACNTATCTSLRYLQQKHPDQKILGVVIPAAEATVKKTRYGRVGVVGTKATIASSTYDIEIQKVAETAYHPKENKALPKIKVEQKACPLLVPLIEEGWAHKPETQMILKKYLRPLKSCNVDTLVLGCTHYAVLEKHFQRFMGKNCQIINSARVQAESFVDYLKRHPEVEKNLPKNKHHRFYTSGCPEYFLEQSRMFLEGKKLSNVEKVVV